MRSLVQLHGSHQSSCGYCHSTSPTRRSFGLTARRLRCDDYQAMIDRGWRRSGDYCYRVDNSAACCPNYAIRVDVHDFTPSKAQRKVERRWQRFINREDDKDATAEAAGAAQREQKSEPEEEKREEPELITRLRAAVLSAVSELQTSGQLQLPTSLTEVTAASTRLSPACPGASVHDLTSRLLVLTAFADSRQRGRASSASTFSHRGQQLQLSASPSAAL